VNENPTKRPTHARRDPGSMNRVPAQGRTPAQRLAQNTQAAHNPSRRRTQGGTARSPKRPAPTPVRQSHAVRTPEQTSAARRNPQNPAYRSGASRRPTNADTNTRSLVPSGPSDLVAAYEERRLARREAREERRLAKQEKRNEAQLEKWEKQDREVRCS